MATTETHESEEWGSAARSLKLSYLWSFSAIGAFGSFIALYYRDLDFTGLEIGILVAIPPIAVAFFGPLWGAIADSQGAHRFVLRSALGVAALVALACTQIATFPAFVAMISLLALFSTPVNAILDSYAITAGERRGISFGSLRVWGSVGYMLTVLVVGRLMGDHVTRLFLIADALFLALALLASFGLPKLGERQRTRLLGGIGFVRGNTRLILLLVTAYLVASGAAIMYGFLGIRIEELGGSATMVGATIAIGAASELPVIAFGGWFLKVFGAPRLIAISIGVYALRLIAYGLVTAPVWILPIQALHGLSYGAFLTASVMLAHRLSGRENAATGQSLLAAVSFGLGNITGSLVGGALLDTVGTAWLFRGGATLMLITLFAYLIAERTVGLGPNEPATT